MITSIEIATKGGPAAAELLLPEGPVSAGSPAGGPVSAGSPAGGPAKVPGIVVIHEWWGINDDIRRMLGRFAGEGIAALAVDLYAGRSTSDPAEAYKLANELSTARAIQIIAGGVEALAAHPRGNGKVAVTGFCLGGAITLAAACNVDGLAAAVPFYGTPKDEFANGWRVKAPILGHFAKNDSFVSIERARQIAAAVAEAGGSMELCEYDAGHAFMREGDPSAYDAASAKLAWDRTMTFLREHLG